MTDPNNLAWRKASYSNGNGGDCVEVADLLDVTLVRDTKDRTRPAVAVSAASWVTFVEGVKLGDFGR